MANLNQLNPELAAAVKAQSHTLTRIYMGRTRALPTHRSQDAYVTDGAVEKFIEKNVQRAFPDGFTVYHTEGGWTYKSGLAKKERSFVVEVADADPLATDTLAREWKTFADQESVLVTTQDLTSMEFVA
jgi:hypothetical protein